MQKRIRSWRRQSRSGRPSNAVDPVTDCKERLIDNVRADGFGKHVTAISDGITGRGSPVVPTADKSVIAFRPVQRVSVSASKQRIVPLLSKK